MLSLQAACYFATDSKYNIIPSEQIQQFQTEVKRLGIIIDNRPECIHALASCQAVISDASSLLFMALPLGKPVLYLKNPIGRGESSEGIKLVNAYEQAEKPGQVIEFIENCMQGEDKNKLKRIIATKQLLHSVDGNAYKRVIETVYNLASNRG